MNEVNRMNEITLGVLGGLGPLATVYFMDMVVKLTDAKRDQEHISMVVLNHPSIPDRTDYILDNSMPNPLPVMIADAKRLEGAGSDFIVIPCNTAHYFYEQIQDNISIPMLNIIEETVDYAVKSVPGLKKLGVLATEGTLCAGSYQRACEKYGVAFARPDEQDEKTLMSLIYDGVKAGEKIDLDAFFGVIDNMKNEGCDAVILGCTELSVIHWDNKIKRADVIDSMETLARASILKCGRKIKEG